MPHVTAAPTATADAPRATHEPTSPAIAGEVARQRAGSGPAGSGRAGMPGPHHSAAPLGGAASVDLLTRLRAPGQPRPPVDAGLAGGLRAWLEDAVTPWAQRAPHDRALHVSGAALAGATGTGGTARDLAVARDAIARALFCLVVLGHEVRHPLADALAMLSVDEHGATIVDRLRHARPAQRATLRRDAALFAGAITEQWRPPPPAWLPRPGERLRVPLAGGRVVLVASADLALGKPAETIASVCMVHVQAAAPSDGDRHVRRFLALTETLRSGAPPFRVATYSAATGELCCDDVTDDLLARAVDDVATALVARRGGTAGSASSVPSAEAGSSR